MNILTKSAILAFAGLALVSQAAQAGVTTHYTDGDFFIGFRLSGNTGGSDYLVDLGRLDLSKSFTISGNSLGSALGNLGLDLKTTFGDAWYSTALFSVVGTAPESLSDVYTTTAGTVFNNDSGNLQMMVHNVWNMGGLYNGSTSTNNSNVGVVQSTTATYSYGDYQVDGNSGAGQYFGYFNDANESHANTGLAFMHLTDIDDGTGTTLGTFSVASNGDVSFISSEAIPEPSTYAMLGVGAAGFIGMMRRRRA